MFTNITMVTGDSSLIISLGGSTQLMRTGMMATKRVRSFFTHTICGLLCSICNLTSLSYTSLMSRAAERAEGLCGKKLSRAKFFFQLIKYSYRHGQFRWSQ